MAPVEVSLALLRDFSTLTSDLDDCTVTIIDAEHLQSRMDGALLTILIQTNSVWPVIARNAVFQSQCSSATPRRVGESARRAGPVGMVEPGEGTCAVFLAAPAAGTARAIPSSTIYRTGFVTVLILHESVALATRPALATSG